MERGQGQGQYLTLPLQVHPGEGVGFCQERVADHSERPLSDVTDRLPINLAVVERRQHLLQDEGVGGCYERQRILAGKQLLGD